MESLSLDEENIIKDIRNLSMKKKKKIIINKKLNFGITIILNAKVMVIKMKHYQLKNILIKISPYLKDIIYNLKKSGTWKIYLTISSNFISSLDNNEEHVMHSKSDNIEIMISDDTDEVMKELFDSLKNR